MLNEIEGKLLKRMYRLGLWKSKHIRLENLMRTGFPSHKLGEVKKAIQVLIQQGFVVYYSKSKRAVQLNHYKYQEIKERIKNGNN